MTRAILAAALFALAAPAHAATMAVWNGPGPRACADKCPQDWALAEAKRAMPADVYAAMVDRVASEPPQRTEVHPGQMLAMNTYAGQNGPVAEVRPILAALDAPGSAEGWHVRDQHGVRWGFVRFEGCGNWQVSAGMPPPPPVQITPRPATYWPAGGYLGPYWGGGSYWGSGSDYYQTVTTLDVTEVYVTKTHPETLERPPVVPPIPLPAALVLLAGGIGLLAFVKMRR